MIRAVYPGSFDPPTIGHMDLIQRASVLFDEVVVAILHNPKKHSMIPLEKRLEFLETACANWPNVKIDSFSGLLADYVKLKEAKLILRGVRSESELGSELPVAALNRDLSGGVETVFLPSSPSLTPVSSSVVREIAAFQGNYLPLIPKSIANQVSEYLTK